MSVLASAINDLFADPHVAEDAFYTPAGGAPLAVRAIVHRPDVHADVLGLRAGTETTRIEVRTTEPATW